MTFDIISYFNDKDNAKQLDQWQALLTKRGSKNPGLIVGGDWPSKAESYPSILAKSKLSGDNVCLLLGPKSAVIDIEYDTDEGKKIVEEWLGGIPTPTYRSGGKSIHRLFKYDDRFKDEPTKVDFHGVEFRFGQDSAQSLIPPSIHPSGSRYEWLPGLSPDDVKPMTLPKEFWDWYVETKAKESAAKIRNAPELSYSSHSVGDDERLLPVARRHVEESQSWNDILVDHGWRYSHSSGVTQYWIRPGKQHGVSATLNLDGNNRLFNFSASVCELDTVHAWDKFAFLCAYDYANDPIDAARNLLPPDKLAECENRYLEKQLKEAASGVDLSKIQANKAGKEGVIANTPTIESVIDELRSRHGFIGDYIDYHLATCHRRQPRFALAGALSLMSVLIGRKIASEDGTRPIFYAMCVGGPGSGKDYAREINAKLLEAAKATDLLMPEDATSDTAILECLSEHPARLFMLDEFGKWLSSITPNNPHGNSACTLIYKLFSSGNREAFKPKAFADRNRNLVIRYPHFSIYVCSTPDALYSSLGLAAIDDGLLSRISVFESRDLPAKTSLRDRLASNITLPQSLVDTCSMWWTYRPGGGNMDVIAREIPLASDIVDELQGYETNICDPRTRASRYGGIWVRSSQTAHVLMLLIAASEATDCEAVQITVEHARIAVKLAHALGSELQTIAEEKLHASDYERKRALVKSAIKSLCDSGKDCTRTAIHGVTRSLVPKERNEILVDLVGTGEVGSKKVCNAEHYYIL